MLPPESSPSGEKRSELFRDPLPREGGRLNGMVIGIAAVVILLLVAGFVVATRHRAPAVDPHVLAAADAYAGSLTISEIAMSEASNGANEKATYIDGKIANTGTRTVTGITVQVIFPLDAGGVDLQAGQAASGGARTRVETMALPVVRMREPYVDLQPVSAAPLKAGDTREFRLIFEKTPDGWNTQPPTIRVVGVRFE